jgi:hypothetical protein
MSHGWDAPITLEYRGHKLVVKFDWEKPNNDSPVAAQVIEEGRIPGLAHSVADLPWSLTIKTCLQRQWLSPSV